MAIELITYSGSNVLPEYDASLHDALGGLNGIISGCEVTTVNNGLHIAAGDGILAGRYFKIDEEQIAVTLPASGSVASALYIHMDLTDADTPIDIIAGPVPSYAYDRTNGIYDLRLATFTAAPGGISSLTDVSPKINPKRIIQRNTAYSAGEIVQCPSAPAGIVLQCTTAGTSAAVEPGGYQTVVSGDTVTDGTATFQAQPAIRPVKVIRDDVSLPVKEIISSGTYIVSDLLESGLYMVSAVINCDPYDDFSNKVYTITHEGKKIAAALFSTSAASLGALITFSLSGIFKVEINDGAEELKFNIPDAPGMYDGKYTLVRL